jgi:hypothetical protein
VRRFFTPGWLGLHAIALALISAFLMLGWWQLQRAGEGNMRSWAYVFEWPLFAIFVVVMWVKMIHDELTGVGEREGAAAAATGSTGSAVRGADVEEIEEEDDELAAYNRYLARLNASAPGPRAQARSEPTLEV